MIVMGKMQSLLDQFATSYGKVDCYSAHGHGQKTSHINPFPVVQKSHSDTNWKLKKINKHI